MKSARGAVTFALALAPAAAGSAAGAGRSGEPTALQVQAARELFSDASKDEDAGRWAAALEKLRRVADVKLTSGIRYHIALCEERLGHTATALAHYTETRAAAREEKNNTTPASRRCATSIPTRPPARATPWPTRRPETPAPRPMARRARAKGRWAATPSVHV